MTGHNKTRKFIDAGSYIGCLSKKIHSITSFGNEEKIQAASSAEVRAHRSVDTMAADHQRLVIDRQSSVHGHTSTNVLITSELGVDQAIPSRTGDQLPALRAEDAGRHTK
jgi:hypothetical protein